VSLKIVAASEPLPVDNLVLTLYSAPGWGKTSLACSADKPLLLDADKGSHRASGVKDRVIINTWSDVMALNADELAPYNTVVIDTGGTLITKLMAHLISQDPKNAGSYGGMSGKGWGNVNSGIDMLLSKIIGAKKDVVIVCHMEEQEKNGNITERIDASGKPRNTIYRLSDAMCRIVMNPDGTRFLDFDPREGGYGKNPAQLGRIPFLHPDKDPNTLANVLAQIKATLNRQSEAQAEAVKRQMEWQQAVAQAQTPEECSALVRLAHEQKHIVGVDLAIYRLLDLISVFDEANVQIHDLGKFNTHVIPLMKELGGTITTIGASVAKREGWKPDKATGLYVAPEVKP
jgi:hypothetical protein